MQASPPAPPARPPPPPSHPDPFIMPSQAFYMNQVPSGAPPASHCYTPGTTSTTSTSASAPILINGQQPQPAYSQVFLAHTSAFLPMAQPPAQISGLGPYRVDNSLHPANSQNPFLSRPNYYQQPGFFPPSLQSAPTAVAIQPSSTASTSLQLPLLQASAQSASVTPVLTPTSKPKVKRWPASQHAALLAAVKQHSPSWVAIAAAVNKAGGPVRSAEGCKQRWLRAKHSTSSRKASSVASTVDSASSSSAPQVRNEAGLSFWSGAGIAPALTLSATAAWSILAPDQPPQHFPHQQQHQHQHQHLQQQQSLPQASVPSATPPSIQCNQSWSAEEDATLVALAQKSTRRRNVPSAFRQALANTTRTDSAIYNRWYKTKIKIKGQASKSSSAATAQTHSQSKASTSTSASKLKSGPRWSPSQDALLLALVKQQGPIFDQVAAELNKAGEPSRSTEGVRDRFYQLQAEQRRSGAFKRLAHAAMPSVFAPTLASCAQAPSSSPSGYGPAPVLGATFPFSATTSATLAQDLADSSAWPSFSLASQQQLHQQAQQVASPPTRQPGYPWTGEEMEKQTHRPLATSIPSSSALAPGDGNLWTSEEDETLRVLGQTIKRNTGALYAAYCAAFPGTTRTIAAVQVRSSIVMRRSRAANGKAGGAEATTSRNSNTTSSPEAASSSQGVGPSPPTIHRQSPSNTRAEALLPSTSGPSTSQAAPRAKRQAKQPQRDPCVLSSS